MCCDMRQSKTSLRGTRAGRAGTPGTSQNTLEQPTQHGRSVPRMVPGAARGETCLSAANTGRAVRTGARVGAQYSRAVLRRTGAARAVAVAAASQDASSQRVAQAAEPHNIAADVCRRDMSVVIRARLTAAMPRRGPTPPGTSFSCHPVTAQKSRTTQLRQPVRPQKGRCATAGMSGEAPFSTRN